MKDAETLETLQGEQLKVTCKAIVGLLNDDRISRFEIHCDKFSKVTLHWDVMLYNGISFYGVSSRTLLIAVNMALDEMRQHLEGEMEENENDTASQEGSGPSASIRRRGRA